MTARRTARNVYIEAMLSAGVSPAVLLIAFAEALRHLKGRRSKEVAALTAALLRYLEERGRLPELAEALEHIDLKDDAPDVRDGMFLLVMDALDVRLGMTATSVHPIMMANRKRLESLRDAVATGSSLSEEGNIRLFRPAPEPCKDPVSERIIFEKAVTLAEEILAHYRAGVDFAVKEVAGRLDERRIAAETKAQRAYDGFVKKAGAKVHSILVEVTEGVPRKGAPTAAEVEACAVAIGETWQETATEFVTSCPVWRLPDGSCFLPEAPTTFPEAPALKLDKMERFKLKVRAVGLKWGMALGVAGAALAAAAGFGLPATAAYVTLGTFGLNVLSGVGLGGVLGGVSWMAWPKWSGKKARLDLEARCNKAIADKKDDLVKLLTDAFAKSADATLEAFRKIKEKEIEQDVALPQQIVDMAAKLSKETAGTAEARRKA